jgi:hypothetical protein
MPNQADNLAELLQDYPELATDLEQMIDPESDGVVGIVGIFSLLQLRLRSVLNLLPQMTSDEEGQPGASEGRS